MIYDGWFNNPFNLKAHTFKLWEIFLIFFYNEPRNKWSVYFLFLEVLLFSCLTSWIDALFFLYFPPTYFLSLYLFALFLKDITTILIFKIFYQIIFTSAIIFLIILFPPQIRASRAHILQLIFLCVNRNILQMLLKTFTELCLFLFNKYSVSLYGCASIYWGCILKNDRHKLVEEVLGM